MTERRRNSSIAFSLTLAILLGPFVSTVRAEVGAVVRDLEASTSYILESIVDDPEPVGNVWIRYGDDTANRRVLNDQGFANGDGNPALVHSLVGEPIAAWSMNSAQGFDVVVSRFTGGSWTQPETVAGSAFDELDPYLVVDRSDGSIHLLYWVAGAFPRVMHREAPADLSTWTAAVQISGPEEIACRPSGAFHAGALKVAYETHDYGPGTVPRQIMVAAQDGSGFTRLMLAITWHADANWPRIHEANGRLWVDWIDTVSDMTWTTEYGPGVWDPVQVEAYESTEERDYHVRGKIRMQVLE